MKANQSSTVLRAYQLWQERGSPSGSPELDWYEAERQLAAGAPSATTLKAVEPNAKAVHAPVQGEGNYEAAQRYREEVTRFVQTADIERLAKEAEPTSTSDVGELDKAEKAGKAHSKGDDPAHVKIMSTK